jgi:hypothetical protein
MPFLESHLRDDLEQVEQQIDGQRYIEAGAGLMKIIFMRGDDDPRLACELFVKLAECKSLSGNIRGACESFDFAAVLAGGNNLYAAWAYSEKARMLEDTGHIAGAGHALKSAAWMLKGPENQGSAEAEALASSIAARSDRLKELGTKETGYPVKTVSAAL